MIYPKRFINFAHILGKSDDHVKDRVLKARTTSESRKPQCNDYVRGLKVSGTLGKRSHTGNILIGHK